MNFKKDLISQQITLVPETGKKTRGVYHNMATQVYYVLEDVSFIMYLSFVIVVGHVCVVLRHCRSRQQVVLRYMFL